MSNVTKVLIVAALAVAVGATFVLKTANAPASAEGEAESAKTAKLPRLLDLGADKCVPCKAMAPILEELKETYADRLRVEFIDVWKNPDAADEFGVQMIPTQIFFDAEGKEQFRHTGFFGREDILGKWKELGVDLGEGGPRKEAFSRWTPAKPDTRLEDQVCYLCDATIDPMTRVAMDTPAGEVAFCSPHCYVITFASMTEEGKNHDGSRATGWASGTAVPVTQAAYLHGMDDDGHTVVRAFATKQAAKDARGGLGGNVLTWERFLEKELETRCGFCDRPVYPEDAARVRVGGMQSWGCCVMCALGVAARTGEDIEVEARDAHTGETVRVKTFEGNIAELAPATAVAWGGARKDAEGKVRSTGCFKQAFFANEANLRAWVEANPTATGHQISMQQALDAKMKLTPEQIIKACKIGECTPK